MSTHNICFCGEIRKIFTLYPLLSRPMYSIRDYGLALLLSCKIIRTQFCELYFSNVNILKC